MRFTLATFTLALAASVAHVQAYFLVASSLTVPGPLPSTTDNRWTRVADLECSTMTTSTSVLNSAEDHAPDWHETWYLDRNGDVVDVDGNLRGNCIVNMSVDKQCDLDTGFAQYQTLFECTTV
ncbi:hypothetical protein IQ06DRAFT_310957 [Phaeosphaeriaceae sp. SRC1lsM3a]|nr:hypothetical protein IQ06DRAFT_310957 [Stagonospora sp. SRC1lsM3a]